MTVRLHRAEYRFEVEGEQALPEAHNRDGLRFLPDLAVVLVSTGYPTNVFVSGPRLDAKGKPLKTRRGQTSWDNEGLDDEHDPAPQWVRQLLQRAVSHEKNRPIDEAVDMIMMRSGNALHRLGEGPAGVDQ